MCENITHKYLYKDKIKILEKKIKSRIDNPTTFNRSNKLI